jgi:hypothetical protein
LGIGDVMQEHFRILDLASRSALPEEIDEQSELPIAVVRELVDAGYLQAIDASSMDGDAYLNPRITLPGREYLRQLQREVSASEKNLIQSSRVVLALIA